MAFAEGAGRAGRAGLTKGWFCGVA
jgi:hypothetical protein